MPDPSRGIDERLAWAEAKLRACRRIALRYAGARALRVEQKPDRSPVTIVDRKIEESLRRELSRAFPGEAIVGEELGSSAQRGSFWTIDPIDGTRAFTRGLPSWGILLGRVERGNAVLGACDFPAINTFLGVGPGTAAYERRRGERILLSRVRKPPTLSQAVIFHGGSRWWSSTRYAKGFARLVRACFLERAYGDCYAYLWVFRGNVDAILDYGVKIWDLVPFAALAAATGRLLADCSGRPSFTGPDSILAHPALVRRIVATLHG